MLFRKRKAWGCEVEENDQKPGAQVTQPLWVGDQWGLDTCRCVGILNRLLQLTASNCQLALGMQALAGLEVIGLYGSGGFRL